MKNLTFITLIVLFTQLNKPLPPTQKKETEKYRILTVTATAYTTSLKENGGHTRTATGHKLRPGIIAVDPKIIPLGSKVHIPGFGYGLALDTGGAIKGKRIDICVASRHIAYRWGRKKVQIKIYTKK